MAKDEGTFVEPSAAGPTQKLEPNADGTTHVIPGKAHEAKEGTVTNPGVRTTGVATDGAMCPSCKRTGTLKMHRNKPVGKRIYCSASDCNYDQAKSTESAVVSDTKVVGKNGPRGVNVLTSRSRN